MNMEDKKTILNQVEEYLANVKTGTIVTTSSLKKNLSHLYGSPENSFIPSDYCYNSYCIGSQWDKEQVFLFEKLDKRGEYKYLGKNYPYTGKTFDKNNNLFGTWENGIFTKATNNSNLKNEFILWLSKQTNSRGKSYSKQSIDIIVKTYEKCIQYLNIGNAKFNNIFEYKTLNEFLIVYGEIKESPYFGLRTDSTNGNFYTEHARYIEFYKTFLEQRSSINDKYDVLQMNYNKEDEMNFNELEVQDEIVQDYENDDEMFEDETECESTEKELDDLKVVSRNINIEIESLKNKRDRNQLILQPEYQRKYVWEKSKASNLIGSILLNIPIPPVFISNENDRWEVIDGQQRLTSIFNYIEDKFPNKNSDGYSDFKLTNLKGLPNEFSNKKFKDLPQKYQNYILSKEIPVIVIEGSTNKEIKFEMFKRLNTGMTKLNNQELRNCLYRGPYNDFIKRMAKYEPFRKIISMPKYENKMIYEELILSYFTFLDMNYQLYKGGLIKLMNKNMEKNRYIDEKYLKEKEDKFKKSVDIIKMMFEDGQAFRIFSFDKKTNTCGFNNAKINQGLFLILMYWFSMYEKNQIVPYIDILREELLNLQIHDNEFIDSLTGGATNSPEKVMRKFDIWGKTVRNILDLPKNEPRCFSYELKQQLFNQNPTCAICGNKINSIDDADVDHITCYSKGGLTIPENARLAHRYCNQQRGNRN